MHVRNTKSGISSLYLLLCGFFCFSFSFPSPQQIRNREFLLHISVLCGFFCLLSLLFCYETKFHSSNSSMLCQLHTAAKPSTVIDVRVILPHPCWRNNLYIAPPRDDDDNDAATEEQQSRWNLGKVNREE